MLLSKASGATLAELHMTSQGAGGAPTPPLTPPPPPWACLASPVG